MIKNKLALVSSLIILVICMCMFFPFPNNLMQEANATFMSFPIEDKDGYILFGIIGSVLFIVALKLLFISLKKHQLLVVLIVFVIYPMVPNLLITPYQETLAKGITAISYENNGQCNFESLGSKMNGECTLELYNRSNKAVSFELEFLDEYPREEERRVASLMNLSGPYNITIAANQKERIFLNEVLDLSNVPKHIDGGSASSVHLKLIEDGNTRIL